MEAKLNIAEILKDKPNGTKLYADAFGELSFEGISIGIIYTRTKAGTLYAFHKNGKCSEYGEPILVPSKEMRDWSKFAWKKGDVLVSNDYGTEVIFDKWYDDTYTNFYGKHYLNSEDKNNIKYNNAFLCTTGRYSLEDRGAAQTYINTIEERLGGKLNRETLEVEKTQPEFKDGDIVVTAGDPYLYYSKCIIILKGDLYTKDNKAHSYAFYNINNKFIDFDIIDTRIRDREIRLATDSEKLQLFDMLTKEGKYWDAEKKQIVDLKPKVELKPFDKVLVRDGNDEIWEPAFFFRNRPELNVYKYQTVGGKLRVYCIPFNEETAKLIDTSNDWKE